MIAVSSLGGVYCLAVTLPANVCVCVWVFFGYIDESRRVVIPESYSEELPPTNYTEKLHEVEVRPLSRIIHE